MCFLSSCILSCLSFSLRTIQNNNTTTSTTLPTEIVVAETTPTIIGTDRCIQFTYYSNSTYYTSKDYTFTTTGNLTCDVLLVGGGGGGDATGEGVLTGILIIGILQYINW